ncbi:MAG: efflux RND transporter periplasmic adaptor subunit [Candidatus Omnitrophota bacterium]
MKRLIPLAIIAALLGAWWRHESLRSESAQYSGTVEAEDAALGSKVGGRVVSVPAKEGDAAKTGDVLVRLERNALEARVKEAEAELERSRQQLLELERGSRPQEIQQAKALLEEARSNLLLMQNGSRQEDIRAAQANVDAAKAEIELAALTEKRQVELFAKKNTSEENLDRARKELRVAQNRLRAAQAELDRLLSGFRTEEIQQAQAKVNAASAALTLMEEGEREETIAQAKADAMRLESALQRARIDLQEADILAPSEGVVETCRLQPGDLLSPNQTALTMILYQPLWIRIYVPESRLGQFSVGEELELTAASFPGQRFKGRIAQVNRRAEYTPRNVQTPDTRDDLVFGVKIDIEDSKRLLRPGMVADVFPMSKNEVAP